MFFNRKKQERITYTAKFVYTNKTFKENYSIYTENGKIIETGNREAIKEQFPFAEEVKLDGILYPGFIDSHIHLNELALSLYSYSGETLKTFNDLKNFVIEHSKSDTIYIQNFDFNLLTKEDWQKLFEIPIPVFIQSIDEHSVFVNNAAIKEHKVEVKDYDGGEAVKQNGKFIGILKDNAILNVSTIKNRRVSKEEIKKTISYLHSMGIVGITNFDYLIYDTLLEMEKEKALNLHIFQGIPCDKASDLIKNKITTGSGSNYLQIGPLKCFIDGSLGSQTLLMKEPQYESKFHGLQTINESELEHIVKVANESRLQVATHAIGSKAVHIALKVFQKVGKSNMRNRIEHFQFLSKDDETLAKETEFIASMQPLHFNADKKLFERYFDNCYQHAYDWKFLFESGKIVAFGSDAPVVSPSVFKGMDSAINRYKEKTSATSVIRAYTEDGARANFYERSGGRIVRNMNADFVLLDKPIKKYTNFSTISVISTIIGGKLVWTK